MLLKLGNEILLTKDELSIIGEVLFSAQLNSTKAPSSLR